jgi:hypothetical protein
MVMAFLENQYIWDGEDPSNVEAVDESSSTRQDTSEHSYTSSTHHDFEETKETAGFNETHRQLLPPLVSLGIL